MPNILEMLDEIRAMPVPDVVDFRGVPRFDRPFYAATIDWTMDDYAAYLRTLPILGLHGEIRELRRLAWRKWGVRV